MFMHVHEVHEVLFVGCYNIISICMSYHFGDIVTRINPRLTEPIFVTQLTKGGGGVPLPSDFQNEPPYDAHFSTNG